MNYLHLLSLIFLAHSITGATYSTTAFSPCFLAHQHEFDNFNDRQEKYKKQCIGDFENKLLELQLYYLSEQKISHADLKSLNGILETCSSAANSTIYFECLWDHVKPLHFHLFS